MADTLRILIGCETSGVMRRRIDGFPDYEVTSDGQIISHHGTAPQLLSPCPDKKGYLGLTICNGPHRRRSVRVHRLVAEAFIPNPDSLPCVRHLDGNPQNNAASNLAWGSYAENEADKLGHGTWDLRRTGKLTKRDREIVRRLAAASVPQKVIADAVGVSRPTITRIINGSIWGCDE